MPVIEWLRTSAFEPPGAVRHVMTRRVYKHLIDEERVLVSTRHHPVVAVWPMPASLLILIFVAAVTAKLSAGNPIVDLLWWGWLASVGYVAWRLAEWNNEIFVVTDRRVMLFTGFLTRRVAMMPLVKVTDLTYRRTIFGRLLRYGDFVIESAGQDQALHLVRFLPNPNELYHDIAGTLFGRGGGRAGEPRPRKAAAVAPFSLRRPREEQSREERQPEDARAGSWRQWRRQSDDDNAPAGNPATVRVARAEERTPHQYVGGWPNRAESGPASAPHRSELEDTATFDAVED